MIFLMIFHATLQAQYIMIYKKELYYLIFIQLTCRGVLSADIAVKPTISLK